MKVRLFIGLGLVLCVAGGPLHARPLADCAGPAELRAIEIARIEVNGVLVAKDGRAIKLEGIRLPDAKLDRAPVFLSEQSQGLLHDLVHGRAVTVTATAPKQDRYDRVRGQVFAEDGIWVQWELLRRGLARVNIAPDRTECASQLYGAEMKARATHAGIWSSSAYAVRGWRDVHSSHAGMFEIVEGSVLNTEMRDGRLYLNFGRDWRRDFSVVIASEDAAAFRAMGVDPRAYTGKTIRVRGIIQTAKAPEIDVANPRQIEIVQ